jgi:hypothetical protein
VTTVDEAAREGSCPAPPEAAESTAESRACARGEEVPPASVALDALTQCARWVRARLARLADRPGSRDGGRPTFTAAREWHHKCAGYYGVPVLRWFRLAWGYAHLVTVKSLTDFADWVTECPSRCAVAAVIAAVIWYGR